MSAAIDVRADVHREMIGRFVESRSAIVLPAEKHYLFDARLQPVMREYGVSDLVELANQISRDGSSPLAQAVIEAMTTNETSFFRDIHPFDALNETLLPELIRSRQQSKRLAIWSAACSTGQELYSIAMLLDSAVTNLSDWDITLHGTDLSTEVLARARSARYSALEVNRGLRAQYLAKYFTRDGTHYLLAEHLRAWATFDRLNFIEPWPGLPRFDIVLCRNVLIYFELEVRQQIIRRIRDVLAPDGYLILGSAETSVGDVQGFTRLSVGRSTIYRKEAH
ncbi:MAG: protein-glutamate O-methyltransferase CheR [Candidatus Nanopelagicales bacterium]